MHKLLGVPEDETISSKYKSGEKLAKDLLKKVDRKTAAGMINFAANINKKETIFDDAQK